MEFVQLMRANATFQILGFYVSFTHTFLHVHVHLHLPLGFGSNGIAISQ